MQTGSWRSHAYGATPTRVTPNAHTFPQGQWPLISEQTIREGQHNPVEKHTGRYAVRRYLNVRTRLAHTTCNVRSLVTIGGKADVRMTLFKDRVRPISEVTVVYRCSQTEGESGGGSSAGRAVCRDVSS
jgi:hypothetical protein